ncbi:MAG: hypothetical protein RL427_789 [Bacteroidota bacterium]|jgi:hypothetical protein
MLKRSTAFALIILFQLVVVGCKNKQQKANDFVTSYNLSAPMITNSIIASTKAKLLDNSDIEIKFNTNLEYNDGNKEMFAQFLPNLMNSVFTKEQSSSDLLDEGVKFTFYFYAVSGVELNSFVVDKQTLQKFLKPTVKDAAAATLGSHANLSPQLQEMLVVMNKSLPIENKAEGTKITKIDIVGKELIYTVEVKNDIVPMLKQEGAASLLKEGILRDNNYSVLLSGIRRFGVSVIRYQYLDSKGTKINEVVIDANAK